MSNSCCASKGLCIHEKLMMIAVIVMAPAMAHFVFHWF
jgi:hypothetical protein